MGIHPLREPALSLRLCVDALAQYPAQPGKEQKRESAPGRERTERVALTALNKADHRLPFTLHLESGSITPLVQTLFRVLRCTRPTASISEANPNRRACIAALFASSQLNLASAKLLTILETEP